jgi:hypothetical protein
LRGTGLKDLAGASGSKVCMCVCVWGGGAGCFVWVGTDGHGGHVSGPVLLHAD